MSGSSLYQKVAEDIRAGIAAGEYAASTKLPSENELAQRYGVSRGTIRQAFAALRADGVIASRRGARRVVFGGPRVQSFGELLSFSRWARAMGEVPGGRVVALERRPATTAEAARLNVPDGGYVYSLMRVRLLSGRPVMVERAVYPEKVGALVAGLDLTRDSITERLEQLGIVFTDAEHVIDAVPATAEDARLLEVRAGTALLRERRFTADRSGQPVESSDDRYLGTETAFSVRNSVSVNALSRTSAPVDRESQNLGHRERARGSSSRLTVARARAGQPEADTDASPHLTAAPPASQRSASGKNNPPVPGGSGPQSEVGERHLRELVVDGAGRSVHDQFGAVADDGVKIGQRGIPRVRTALGAMADAWLRAGLADRVQHYWHGLAGDPKIDAYAYRALPGSGHVLAGHLLYLRILDTGPQNRLRLALADEQARVAGRGARRHRGRASSAGRAGHRHSQQPRDHPQRPARPPASDLHVCLPLLPSP